ncbi:unnamed protein product, partial [Amoebophrya sp. A25]
VGVVLPLDEEESKSHSGTTFVGVAYQLTSLGKLDTVAETVELGFEVSMLYKVTDEEDIASYREHVGEECSFSEMKLKNPMPNFRILSAANEPECISESIVAVRECVDRELVTRSGEVIGRDSSSNRAQQPCGEREVLIPGLNCPASPAEEKPRLRTSFFVQTYGKYRCLCNQVMDLESFPFSRMLLRLIFVN